tara:strand:+ start:640 stop:813 length:174 start_codon:yes stop_codon:yes gene_type:complete
MVESTMAETVMVKTVMVEQSALSQASEQWRTTQEGLPGGGQAFWSLLVRLAPSWRLH